MKRKNAIASDSEAESDTEVPKGTLLLLYIYISIPLSAFNCGTFATLGVYPQLQDSQKRMWIRLVYPGKLYRYEKLLTLK